jgi:hypothetical protein
VTAHDSLTGSTTICAARSLGTNAAVLLVGIENFVCEPGLGLYDVGEDALRSLTDPSPQRQGVDLAALRSGACWHRRESEWAQRVPVPQRRGANAVTQMQRGRGASSPDALQNQSSQPNERSLDSSVCHTSPATSPRAEKALEEAPICPDASVVEGGRCGH